MAILTDQEIQAQLMVVYKTKQELNALDKQFNQQAAAITAKAKQDVEALRATLAAQRATLVASIEAAQKLLDEGK